MAGSGRGSNAIPADVYMSTFDVDSERITVIRIDDGYLFSHNFEREDRVSN
jgi:hypothetical protein